MIAWTDSARKVWAAYSEQTSAALKGSGADPGEVLEDLKRHVDEEAATAKLGVVTEGDLRRMLGKFGPASGPSLAGGDPELVKEVAPAEDSNLGKFGAVALLFFCVLLPVITIVFEWITGISADCLFDPIPSWYHIVLVALVPIGNACLWWAALRRRAAASRWVGWLAGFAIGVCLYYSLLYLLFVPFAFVGLIYFGLGLIPLTPHLALLASLVLRYKFCAVCGIPRLRGYVPAMVIAVVCLFGLQLPESLTYYGLTRARSEEPAVRERGISVLRLCGSRTVMLRACYGWLEWREIFNPINILATGRESRVISADEARELFYRVTGEAFNSVAPPSFHTRAGRWADLDDYVWDDGLGGEQVAGRVKGLSLLSSRLDTTTEPVAGLAYCEWIMEFKNVSAVQREARAEVALPPGAVVSRVTLWVNGEEREAAFGGRSQTRAAYKEVAVEHRRDPLLVTTCGPDRVLVQCFPIQPNGGTMKIRLGMTAPLVLDTLTTGNFVWPHFVERNFGISRDFKHSLWLEQPGADGAMVGTHETLAESNLVSRLHATLVHRPAEVTTVWAPGDAPGQFVWQTIEPIKVPAPHRMVVVVDGSAGMKRYAADIARAIALISEDTEVALMMASDAVGPMASAARPASADEKRSLQRQLRRAKFTGGQDNLPALESAWDLADDSNDGDVVWIHMPEAVQLSSESGVCQRLERNHKATRLYEVELGAGPDRVVEKLDALPGIVHAISYTRGQNGFDRLVGIWSGRNSVFKFDRQLTNNVTGLANVWRAGGHLVRLWARDESLRLADAHHGTAAASLATKNQLVTPFTGAVVLENQTQYDRYGLSPAASDTVPQIPEPRDLTSLAFLIALLVLWQRRHHQANRTR